MPGTAVLFPLQVARSDIGLLADRIVVAEHAVGGERIAGDDGVFIGPDRMQADDRELLAAIPLEWRRAWRPLAGCNRIREHHALHEGLQGADLAGRPPVHV